jgi:hypothetical protein
LHLSTAVSIELLVAFTPAVELTVEVQSSVMADPDPEADDLSTARPSAYLPDEILLEILSHIPQTQSSQPTLHAFCLVSWHWYKVGIRRLYAEPYLAGSAYALFVRTICPSINVHVRRSPLAGLVHVLDLSHIVHQGSKAITARLLGRTKENLQVFIAPQASFAVNCWAALSKCLKLRYLNLSLVSESISYPNMTQTVRQLPELEEIYLPRCSSSYDSTQLHMNIKWPPKLRVLQLSGGVHGKFLFDLITQTDNFPVTMTHLSIAHCPKAQVSQLRRLLENLSPVLRHLELRDLPQVSMGELSDVLDWATNLKSLTIALDYVDMTFGNMPPGFNSGMWEHAKPLESLNLITSGSHEPGADMAFSPHDLKELIDSRFLGRLRYICIADTTGWDDSDIDELRVDLHRLDFENWTYRRWHYADLMVSDKMEYAEWIMEPRNRKWAPKLRTVRTSHY